MDFRNFPDSFGNKDYRSHADRFDAFVFVLATQAADGCYASFVDALPEIHDFTGRSLLVVAPEVALHHAPDVLLRADQISKALAHGFFEDEQGRRQTVDRTEFMWKQARQTYEVADYLGLPYGMLPGLAFMTSLDAPQTFLYWRAQTITTAAVISVLRGVVDEIRASDAQEVRLLDVIRSTDEDRFEERKLRGC